ncbi:hypothetical protein EON77_00760 [bacterium]|nr:MAG: hypothetical protein EON77_00760 [bacterium]
MAEAARARPAISGYVVAHLRDTPVTTSGLFDDFGAERFGTAEIAVWNSPTLLFLNPMRRAPWRSGGNVPRTLDPLCVTPGTAMWRIGAHSETPLSGRALWRLRDLEGVVVAEGVGASVCVPSLVPRDLTEIHWSISTPGRYSLEVEFGEAHASWPILVVAPALEEIPLLYRWDAQAEARFASGEPAIIQIGAEGPDVVPGSFWRECALLFDGISSGFESVSEPEFNLGVSVRSSLDLTAWKERVGEITPLIRRVDLRDYTQTAYAFRTRNLIVTTLPLTERADEPWTPQSAAPDLFRAWFEDILHEAGHGGSTGPA